MNFPQVNSAILSRGSWVCPLNQLNSDLECDGVSSQMDELEDKLERELQSSAKVVACRFPFPSWVPDATAGEGIDTVWVYDASTFKSRRGTATLQTAPSPARLQSTDDKTVAWPCLLQYECQSSASKSSNGKCYRLCKTCGHKFWFWYKRLIEWKRFISNALFCMGRYGSHKRPYIRTFYSSVRKW